VLPLLDVYRRYYGLRMAATIAGIFYVTMVASGLIMDLAFGALGLVPPHATMQAGEQMAFRIDATFWLNLLALGCAVALFLTARRHPMSPAHACAHHAHAMHQHGGQDD